ncbi:hypothetical protein ACHAPD_006934 [Fusarium lateritium]
MLWAQDALPPTPEFTTSLALIPNVVICLNVLDTYDGGRECNEVGWRVSASASVEGSRAGESPVPTIATQNLSDTGSEARKVLLVEDNHINLKILAAYMKKLNLEYDTAVSGKEAVEMYTQLPKAFICILLDISMTVMNDFEAA